jgi:hypothetical protein
MPKEGQYLPQPVVIVGAGRSGTKFLRDILAVSENVAAIPFDVNYVWRFGHEGAESDVLDPGDLTEESREFIRTSLRRLARVDRNDSTSVLLEKTVSNCLRLDYVDAVLPEARFLHLIRDGRAVAESAYRVWEKSPGGGYLLRKLRYFPWRNYRYAFWYVGNLLGFHGAQKVWGPRYPGIIADLVSMDLLDVCARQWKECVLSATKSLAALPADRVLTVTYEEFVTNESVLEEICHFCGVPVGIDLRENYRSKVEPTNACKWRRNLSPTEIAQLNESLGDTLELLGYKT